MTDLVRATWLDRVFGATLLGFTAAVAALLASGAESALVATPAAVVLVIGLWTTGDLTQAMADGSHGELMLRDGTRVPVAPLQRSWLADRTELAVWCLTAVVIAARVVVEPSATAGAALLGSAICGGLLWNVHRARGLNRRLFRAQLAVQDGRLTQAITEITPLLTRSDAYADAAETLRSSVRIRTGDVAGGMASEARRWRGTLDVTAATVALHRLAAGDRELADAWMSAFVGSDRQHLGSAGRQVRAHHRPPGRLGRARGAAAQPLRRAAVAGGRARPRGPRATAGPAALSRW